MAERSELKVRDMKRKRRKRTVSKKDYHSYIRSKAWQEKRRQYWSSGSASYRCVCCRANDKPLDLHHRTYRTLGNESPCDLVAVCRDCHDVIHRLHNEMGGSLSIATKAVARMRGDMAKVYKARGFIMRRWGKRRREKYGLPTRGHVDDQVFNTAWERSE